MTKTLYMLRTIEHADLSGPLLGEPGLDFGALAKLFREDCYAKAEAEQQDHCYVSESDFVPWLIQRGVLSPAENTSVCVAIDTSGENRYQPKHWPLCPACGQSRCDEQSGEIHHALNRWQWFRKCDECGHTFDHIEYPYDGKKPMLDDDGRYTDSGCVPYTISQVGGLPFPAVLEACRERGWSEGHGMIDSAGLDVAKQFGLTVKPLWLRDLLRQDGTVFKGKLTIKRVLEGLDKDSNYIVATHGHWLPVVRGENRDGAQTNLRTEVTRCWEVQS